LDAKVRIWSIPDRQVVDWTDLHEMVTAACYTPDGQVGLRLICIFLNTQKYNFMFNSVKLSVQGALVGSYKGSCHLYNTSGIVRCFLFLKLSIYLYSGDCGATDYRFVFSFRK